MDDARGDFHGGYGGSYGTSPSHKQFHGIIKAHGGKVGGGGFHVPAKNIQAFHAEAAKAGYFHGSKGHYLMHHKKHAPDEQFSERQEDYLPPDATPVTLAPPVLAPMVQFREEAFVPMEKSPPAEVEQFAEGTHVEYRGFKIEPTEGVQIGHKLPNSRSLLAQIGHKTHRKSKGYLSTDLENGTQRFHPTHKHAKSFIDQYHGDS